MLFRTRIVGIVLAIALSTTTLLGQRRSNQSFFSLWAEGGYTAFMHNIEPARDYGSVGGGLGLGYEFHHNNFIFTTGAEFILFNSTSKMDGYLVDRETYDSEGYEVVYKYNFYRFRERYLAGNIQVPILFGGRSRSFYALGGVKMGFNIFANAKVESEFETKGWYKQYIDEFENMPNHYYFQGYEASGKQKLDVSVINVSLSAEVGWFLQNMDGFQKPNPVGRIAFFCDYGLNNIMKGAAYEGDFLRFPRANPVDIEHYSILQSEVGYGKRVNTFVVGFKVTLLFQFPSKRSCNCINGYYSRIFGDR